MLLMSKTERNKITSIFFFPIVFPLGVLLPVNPYWLFQTCGSFQSENLDTFLSFGIVLAIRELKVAQNLYVSQSFNKGYTFLLEGLNKAAFTFACFSKLQWVCSAFFFLNAPFFYCPQVIYLISMRWFIAEIYPFMSFDINLWYKKNPIFLVCCIVCVVE